MAGRSVGERGAPVPLLPYVSCGCVKAMYTTFPPLLRIQNPALILFAQTTPHSILQRLALQERPLTL